MTDFVIRVIVILLVAGLLWMQARAARDQPHRRRGFELAAAALLTFAVFTGSLGVSQEIGVLQYVVGIAGLVLFAGAVVSLVLSLQSGEMRAQRDRMNAAAKEYRERRTAERESRTKDQ